MMTSLVARVACRLHVQWQNTTLASCTGLQRFYCKKSEEIKESQIPESDYTEEKSYDRRKLDIVYPKTYDRLILVWSKEFPSLDSIPEYVSAGQLNKAHDIKRIKINLHMFVFGLTCLGVGLWEGKKERASGRKTEERAQEERMMNLRWEHIKEQDAKDEAKFQEELRKFREEEAVYYEKNNREKL